MPSTSNYCRDCERECGENICTHCESGSQQLITTTHVSFFPSFSVRRVVVKGEDREVQLSLPSMTDRNSK